MKQLEMDRKRTAKLIAKQETYEEIQREKVLYIHIYIYTRPKSVSFNIHPCVEIDMRSSVCDRISSTHARMASMRAGEHMLQIYSHVFSEHEVTRIVSETKLAVKRKRPVALTPNFQITKIGSGTD